MFSGATDELTALCMSFSFLSFLEVVFFSVLTCCDSRRFLFGLGAMGKAVQLSDEGLTTALDLPSFTGGGGGGGILDRGY